MIYGEQEMNQKMSVFSKKKSAFFASNLLFSFLIVQSTFLPNSYSYPVTSHLDPSVKSRKSAHVDYQIDTARNEFTFIDYATSAFAVFPTAESLEVPTRIGKLEWSEDSYRLVTTRFIKSFGDLYAVSNPQNPDFLMISERLPEGGFGRLLRYRGPSDAGIWVNLEFVYQDREDKVTILDYGKGKFYRTTFAKNSAKPPLVFPIPDPRATEGELVATQTSSTKFIGPQGIGVTPSRPHVSWLPLQFEILNEQDLWMNRHVRGPPMEGTAL